MNKLMLFVVFSFMLSLSALAKNTSNDTDNDFVDGIVKLDGHSMLSLKEAMANAVDGSRITIGKGVYKDGGILKANFVTIEGVKGTHLKDYSTQGKGTLVIQGSDIEVINIECSGVQVRDQNGACIRFEGKNIQLKQVYFHDSEQGLLSGHDPGLILIDGSRFERLGKIGRAHAIYVGGGELYINNSKFLSSKGEGHEVKSRAKKTIISNSIIASLEGKDSRLIDIPNGGILDISNSILQQGNNTSNSNLIGFALEGNRYKNNIINIEGNIFILERKNGNQVLKAKGKLQSKNVDNNTFIGRFFDSRFNDSNLFFETLSDANLKPISVLIEKGLID